MPAVANKRLSLAALGSKSMSAWRRLSILSAVKSSARFVFRISSWAYFERVRSKYFGPAFAGGASEASMALGPSGR